jgi:CheY-like chemotaxis protein
MKNAEPERILVVDDEESFLYSTADLLRREGYQCDCALDGVAASQMLRDGEYDLLIAELNMPGNADLELVHEARRFREGLPIILVTARPSLNSAIRSIQLRVADYIVKPVELGELLSQVRAVINNFRVQRAVGRERERLHCWRKDLAGFGQEMPVSAKLTTPLPVGAFVNLTCRNIADALSDLKHITEALATGNTQREACHLFKCSRLTLLTEALEETVEILEKTRNSFKSKELGELRKKLKTLL